MTPQSTTKKKPTQTFAHFTLPYNSVRIQCNHWEANPSQDPIPSRECNLQVWGLNILFKTKYLDCTRTRIAMVRFFMVNMLRMPKNTRLFFANFTVYFAVIVIIVSDHVPISLSDTMNNF